VSCFILPSSFIRCFIHPRSRAGVGQLPPSFVVVSCGADFVLSFFEFPAGRMSSTRPSLFPTKHFVLQDPKSFKVLVCLPLPTARQLVLVSIRFGLGLRFSLFEFSFPVSQVPDSNFLCHVLFCRHPSFAASFTLGREPAWGSCHLVLSLSAMALILFCRF
jgi:hypothetical protein